MSRKKTHLIELPEVSVSDDGEVRHLHLGTPWIQGSMRIAEPFELELEYVQRMMAWLLFADPAQVSKGHAMQLGLGAGAITKFCPSNRRRILCICTVFMRTTANPKLYSPRHPERTLLYQTVAEHYETWLELASAGQFDGQGDHHTPKPYVCKAFAKYLECGIFAHGFARARCGDCGHNYFVAFSCKGRGVCPSCTTRRMVETAAHLTDHVFPRLPVRQWVLSVPKRLRYYMQRDSATLNMVLRIFLRVIAQSLQAHCPGAANADKASLHIGAVAFIHRFGSSLNEHVHFHVCVVDGVFEAVEGEGSADAPMQASSPSVVFHPASGIDAATVAQVQTTLQKRILRAFVTRGLLESSDAKDMQGYKHSGFSVDAGVCIGVPSFSVQ